MSEWQTGETLTRPAREADIFGCHSCVMGSRGRRNIIVATQNPPLSNVLSLKPTVGQNIAQYASLADRKSARPIAACPIAACPIAAFPIAAFPIAACPIAAFALHSISFSPNNFQTYSDV